MLGKHFTEQEEKSITIIMNPIPGGTLGHMVREDMMLQVVL